MTSRHTCIILLCLPFLPACLSAAGHPAPAPLFRDPIYDGAADPVLIWNRQEQSWWMLYTQRRANVEGADVAYCYGNQIGIASSRDQGRSWLYRGTLDLAIEPGQNTFWAPDVVYHEGQYHLFVVYIQGVRNHWGGQKRIAHYMSDNLWDWQHLGFLTLTSDSVIDVTLMQMPDGLWRMWYKDEKRGSVTMTATSRDLLTWQASLDPAIGGRGHEGPKAFRFSGSYWMLTDEWAGMRVYRSEDALTWKRQGRILAGPSSRTEDGPSGAHGDVVVCGEKAYVFYFTHPEREAHGRVTMDARGNTPYGQRRSSIQVGELKTEGGTLVCERENFDFYLPNLARETMMFADTFRNDIPFSKDPHVVHFGGRYLMYYSVPPYRKPDAPVKGWGIGIAESRNLIHWQRIGEVTPQADYESKGLCAPCARVIDGQVHLFYQTYGNGKRDAICHAVSQDGLQFTRNATNPIFAPTGAWTSGRAIDAEVIAYRGRYLLYFATRDPSMKIQMTGVAAAPLGTNFNRDQWTQLVDGPVIEPELPWEGLCVEGASVLPRNGKLYLFYAGNYNNAPQQVGVASSDDGLSWTRLSEDPFLPHGKPGTWNTSESGHPHIFTDVQGRTWLFYQGNSDRGKTWTLSKVEVKWNDRGPYLERERP